MKKTKPSEIVLPEWAKNQVETEAKLEALMRKLGELPNFKKHFEDLEFTEWYLEVMEILGVVGTLGCERHE